MWGGGTSQEQQGVPGGRVGEMILETGVGLKALAVLLLVSRSERLGWFLSSEVIPGEV